MAKNVSSKPKICEKCGVEYQPTSNRQKYCVPCIAEVNRIHCREYRSRTFVPKGYNQKAENNNNWKGGIGYYKRHFVLKGKICEACGSDKHIVRHHIDHNRYNNDESNIVWVCRKCHARHHRGCKPDPLDNIERIHK